MLARVELEHLKVGRYRSARAAAPDQQSVVLMGYGSLVTTSSERLCGPLNPRAMFDIIGSEVGGAA